MTEQETTHWHNVCDKLFKNRKYQYVHKLYSRSGGWCHITGRLKNNARQQRITVTYKDDYAHIWGVLNRFHDSLPEKLQYDPN